MKVKIFISLTAFVLLLLGGAFTGYRASIPPSPAQVAQEISSNLKSELARVDSDVNIFRSLKSPSDIMVTSFTFPTFLFQNGVLAFWSDNGFVPAYQQVADQFQTRLLNNGSESYLLRKTLIDRDRFIISVIKLVRRYSITNDYLNTEYNTRLFKSGDITILEPTASLGAPVCIGRDCLFRISYLSSTYPRNESLRVTSLILLALAVLSYLYLLSVLISEVRRRSGAAGFLVLLAGLFLLRWLMTLFAFPRILLHTPLFDPQVFAASSLNASLGDLLINVIAVQVLAAYIFINYPRLVLSRKSGKGVVTQFLAALALLFASLYPMVVIQTLYNNSTLGLDVLKVLDLDATGSIAFFIVIVAGISAFLVSHAALRLFIGSKNPIASILSFMAAIGVFIGINELTGQVYGSTLVTSSIYFLLVVTLRLYKTLRRLSFNTFAYLFTAIVFLSINGAVVIAHFTQRQKMETQLKFASNFLVDRDYFAEYLLSEGAEKISKDIFILSRFKNPLLGRDAIRQKIRHVFLPGYFNKYDVEILLFNAVGDPLDNSAPPFSQYISRYDQDAYRTDYPRLRFINNPATDVAQKYIIICPIGRAHNEGYVVVELSLKKVIPETVYPELLVDYRFQHLYRTHDLSYAVFVNKNIVLTSGDFNYEKQFEKRWLGETSLYQSGISADDYDHIALEEQSGRVAVVSSRAIPFAVKLANFSLLLGLGLLTILLLIFVQGIYLYFRGTRLFFSARIQLYLNLAFFIPLIIVSISTLGLASRSSQRQLDDEYRNRSRIFGDQIVSNTLGQNSGDAIDNADIETIVRDLAKLSNLDANLYDATGKLLTTSQPMIFESNLISSFVNPRAFYRVLEGQNLFIESEKVGKLKYFVSYSVLKSAQTGKVMGILGLPFFQSGYLLNRMQSVILIDILNVFAFIFIILLLLSYLVAERLTFPLRFITQSLRRTSLTQQNAPLTWPAKDEIGLMVKEYNAMLYKLSESKSQLENTQREKAWREIAQQVAHEIKNPLTPMKLTLQQLERAVQAGSVTPEKTQKAIGTLLSQVDTLNDIASSFSGFVKMPELVIQRVDLLAILKRVIDLHSPTGEIDLKTSLREAFVDADVQLISRTFSNLILNSFQAERPGHPIRVRISVNKLQGAFRIAFEDNGKGIDSSIADRVFLPHFSTKKTGSGLGLAIAKQGITQMNGKIWFETSPGTGTTFFIDLPEAIKVVPGV